MTNGDRCAKLVLVVECRAPFGTARWAAVEGGLLGSALVRPIVAVQTKRILRSPLLAQGCPSRTSAPRSRSRVKRTAFARPEPYWFDPLHRALPQSSSLISLPRSFGAREPPAAIRCPPKWIGRYGALLPLFIARRRPLHRRIVESEKLPASPQRSGTSVCQGCANLCYCKITLRFSSNSALSISPLANRSFKISRAREAVSDTSGSSTRRTLR
jgi:hypothetical protein